MNILWALGALPLLAGGWWYWRQQMIAEKAYGRSDIYRAVHRRWRYEPLAKALAARQADDERYLFCVVLSRCTPMPLLERWVVSQPHSSDAHLCYGVRLIQQTIAAMADDDRWPTAPEKTKFREAQAHLEDAARFAPNDATPYIYLILSAMWLQQGVDRYFFWFSKATAIAPNNYGLHVIMVLALSKKWGGDNQHMFGFAKRVAAQAPAGSDLKLLPFKALLEQWKYYRDRHPDRMSVQALLADPSLQDYSQRLFATWRDGHTVQATTHFALYHALAWLWLIKDEAATAEVLARLDGHVRDIHLKWTGIAGRLPAIKAGIAA